MIFSSVSFMPASTFSGFHSVAFTRAYIGPPSGARLDGVGGVVDDALVGARPVRVHRRALGDVRGRLLPRQERLLAVPFAQQDVAERLPFVVGRLVAAQQFVADVPGGAFDVGRHL